MPVCLCLCWSAQRLGWVHKRVTVATTEAVKRSRASCALCFVQMCPLYILWSPGKLKKKVTYVSNVWRCWQQNTVLVLHVCTRNRKGKKVGHKLSNTSNWTSLTNCVYCRLGCMPNTIWHSTFLILIPFLKDASPCRLSARKRWYTCLVAILLR